VPDHLDRAGLFQDVGGARVSMVPRGWTAMVAAPASTRRASASTNCCSSGRLRSVRKYCLNLACADGQVAIPPAGFGGCGQLDTVGGKNRR